MNTNPEYIHIGLIVRRNNDTENGWEYRPLDSNDTDWGSFEGPVGQAVAADLDSKHPRPETVTLDPYPPAGLGATTYTKRDGNWYDPDGQLVHGDINLRLVASLNTINRLVNHDPDTTGAAKDNDTAGFGVLYAPGTK